MAPTPSKTETVIELVHRLDELKEHRAKVLAELDTEIAATMRALEKFTGETARPVSNGSGHVPAGETRDPQLPLAEGKKSFAATALNLLKTHPHASTADLANALYGNDEAKSRDKARAVIYFLVNKAKRIRRLPNEGGWEVIADG